EALYVLATTRSHRTSAEREMVNWHAEGSPVFARIAADVQRQPAPQRLEVILAEAPGAGGTEEAAAFPPLPGSLAHARSTPEPSGRGAPGGAPGTEGQPPATSVRRRVRINGQHRQPLELLGHFNVVLFSPEDVELIAGPAALRRRYLDITLCQVDHVYLRTLNRYQRVLQQRNALLREARERAVRPDQFEYWDLQLVDLGSAVIAARLRAVALLNTYIEAILPRLTSDPQGLRLEYRSSVRPGAEEAAPAPAAGGGGGDSGPDDLARLRVQFVARLEMTRARERQQATTLTGPHRDDAMFLAGQVDLRVFGSRGQQRTAALCLKLAEVELMAHHTGERPVLLLDDVMSELDPSRRHLLQGMILEQGQQQVIMTATDPSPFEAPFLHGADVYQVEAGAIRPAPAA
ncbi:MAG TPA: DNA replication and repair protein RecF, partial [Chloroflexota bacterium]|nr:DNA replication and repair protein RecF [Chloroflexota bacterium]